jgi:hypothetical protein
MVSKPARPPCIFASATGPTLNEGLDYHELNFSNILSLGPPPSGFGKGHAYVGRIVQKKPWLTLCGNQGLHLPRCPGRRAIFASERRIREIQCVCHGFMGHLAGVGVEALTERLVLLHGAHKAFVGEF